MLASSNLISPVTSTTASTFNVNLTNPQTLATVQVSNLTASTIQTIVGGTVVASNYTGTVSVSNLPALATVIGRISGQGVGVGTFNTATIDTSGNLYVGTIQSIVGGTINVSNQFTSATVSVSNQFTSATVSVSNLPALATVGISAGTVTIVSTVTSVQTVVGGTLNLISSITTANYLGNVGTINTITGGTITLVSSQTTQTYLGNVGTINTITGGTIGVLNSQIGGTINYIGSVGIMGAYNFSNITTGTTTIKSSAGVFHTLAWNPLQPANSTIKILNGSAVQATIYIAGFPALTTLPPAATEFDCIFATLTSVIIGASTFTVTYL